MTLVIEWFLQAVSFSLTPPMLMTSPKVVISPVRAILPNTGLFVAIDIKATNRDTPAEGPSLGMAP
jgi:hypothetical protein